MSQAARIEFVNPWPICPLCRGTFGIENMYIHIAGTIDGKCPGTTDFDCTKCGKNNEDGDGAQGFCKACADEEEAADNYYGYLPGATCGAANDADGEVTGCPICGGEFSATEIDEHIASSTDTWCPGIDDEDDEFATDGDDEEEEDEVGRSEKTGRQSQSGVRPPLIPLTHETLAYELRSAIHRFQDAPLRWSERKVTGLSDANLKAAISKEFGLHGGSSGAGSEGNEHIGGTDPKFYYGSRYRAGKPTLHGQTLIKAVRTLMEIPFPLGTQERAQISLF